MYIRYIELGDLCLLNIIMNMLGKQNSNEQIQDNINKINLVSYNVNNFNDTKCYAIEDIFKENTFLLIQETWLSDDEFIRRFKLKFENTECI